MDGTTTTVGTARQMAIVAFEGCLTSAVTGISDALQIANRCALQRSGCAPFGTHVLAAEPGLVRGTGGFAIPAAAFDSCTPIDVAIVPPIVGPVSHTLQSNPKLLAWLRARPSPLIASVCTGAFFLAEAGLLSGRRATTNPGFAEAFRRRYPDVELRADAALVEQDQVLCAGSTTACLNLTLYLIERFAGHELAVLVAKSLCVDMRGSSQLPYFVYVAPKDHGDAAVLKLQHWIEAHYVATLSAAELARRAGMSVRTLHRRFRGATGLSPTDYLHRVRIESAKRQLETSSRSVQEITAQVGYEDLRSFCRLFRSLVGVSPGQYRRRFGAAALGSQLHAE